MGAARSALRRSLRSPVETRGRLDKVLDSEPKLAPKHESTKELLEEVMSGNQMVFDAHNKKNDQYLDSLKGIHVIATDWSEDEKKQGSSSSNTPQAAQQTTRLTIEQLTFLFQQRMIKPEVWDEEKIAAHFKLPSKTVENLLKYYSDFNVEKAPQIPEPLAEITH